MDPLDRLESASVTVIREAYHRFERMALLWSMGKDSTTLLWLCRKAFLGRVPFPVVHLDTGRKFPEMYAFRDRYAREWGLDLIVARNEAALAEGVSPDTVPVSQCCHRLKTEALTQAIQRHGFQAVLLGIRRDEHGVRAKERYFSPRDARSQWHYRHQPAELWGHYASADAEGGHLRIHPLLHAREVDVWRYVRREGIPAVGLYFARDGARYRSIGCRTCCSPVASEARTVDAVIDEVTASTVAERHGRVQDKERAYTMQKLRALGYM
ncbi:sulfate adenylyltransferase subunit CysD [bacterium]|nr:sulfate adenylyltransferase subunit CysD [bacterium]